MPLRWHGAINEFSCNDRSNSKQEMGNSSEVDQDAHF